MPEVSVTETFLEGSVREAADLRRHKSLPGPGADPQEVLESLLEVRRRYDRVEEIYLTVLQVRGKIARAKQARQAEAEDAWNEALKRARASPTREDYEGPRERYAEADLATIDFKVKARQAEALASIADGALECIKTVLRGLDGTRQDHLTWLRSLSFQSHLET